MRILIATTLVPFVRGSAEMQAEELAAELRSQGHDTAIAAIPFKSYPPSQIADDMLACRMFDLTESYGRIIDRVIALKFPAYFVSHPNKILWLVNQHRAAYDSWLAGNSELLHEPSGAQIRDMIIAADRNVLSEARAIYTISKTVGTRLEKFCGVPSKPLYHPPPAASRYRSGEYGDYFLMPGRVTAARRQLLVLEAVERASEPVRVCFMGGAEGPDVADEFRRRLETSSAAGRVSWLGDVTLERRIDAYAESRAVIFPPIDDDYGYVTLRAMLAAKAVVTCSDSGAPLEFVQPGETGLVCEPQPDALAAGMDALWSDRARAMRYGKSGRAVYDEMNISWDGPISCLLA